MDEFILPERWHIVTTSENIKDVWEWRMNEPYRSNDRILTIDKIVGMCNPDEKGHNPKSNIKSDNGSYDFGIEITYDQFKEHVLNQKPKSKKKVKKENLSYLIPLFKELNIK